MSAKQGETWFFFSLSSLKSETELWLNIKINIETGAYFWMKYYMKSVETLLVIEQI